MANRVRVDIHHADFAALLRSNEVRRDLERRAAAIAAAAGPGMEYDSGLERERARATVWTETIGAMLGEAYYRSLTRAIDAGRR